MNLSQINQSQFKIGVLPDINRLTLSSTGNNSIPAISTASGQYLMENKKTNLAYLSGAVGASLEVLSGLLLLAKSTKKLEKLPLKKMADLTLAAAYLVAIPNDFSASLKSKQPGMFLSASLWAMSIPFMNNINTRIKGMLYLAYAPSFASFANTIHNDYHLKDGEPKRYQDINWKKPWDIIKFSFKDQAIAFKTVATTVKDTLKQTKDYLNGNRQEPPGIFSTKPSKASMSLASVLIILGSVPKIISGQKLGKFGLGLMDKIIGAGMIFDSLGMMSLANTKKDFRRPALLIGGPMRIIGDFKHEEDFFYGLRTIGGAACMYYWAGINKENQ